MLPQCAEKLAVKGIETNQMETNRVGVSSLRHYRKYKKDDSSARYLGDETPREITRHYVPKPLSGLFQCVAGL